MEVCDGKTYTEFTKAVEMNDTSTVNTMLQSMPQENIILDINGVNGDNKTPLIVAITSNQAEITSQLLKNGAKTDEALMYAIDVCSETIVTLLCEHLKVISETTLQVELDALSKDSRFKPISNSLMFASRRNHLEIVKVLIQYGATIPDLQTVLEHSNGDSYEEYLACLGWHQAKSSEAYLLHSSHDPLEATISAGKAIKKAKSLQPHHLRSNFDPLIANLDQFVTHLVIQSSSEEEISRLLWDDLENNNNTGAKNGALPQRLHYFLDLGYKQFVSSTACQHFILDQWYMKWKDLSLPWFTLWTLVVAIFQPLLCLSYVILPLKFNRRFMKTPYIRFMVHLVSRIYFMCFILFTTIRSSEAADMVGDETENWKLAVLHLVKPRHPIDIITYIWILGMTWRELRELFTGGFKSYWKDVFNYIDILQLALYWLALVFQAQSYDNIKGEFTEFCKIFSNLDIEEIEEMSMFGSEFDGSFLVKLCDSIESQILLHTRDIANASYPRDTNVENSADDDQPTFRVDANDPRLIAEALFAVATVLSFLALLRDFVMVAFVGPLRASFGGMISDIVRFLLLFFFVWVSFALGMTQLYTTYDIINLLNCHDNGQKCPGQKCSKTSSFITLTESLSTLFWSLFNPVAADALYIDPHYKITSVLGVLLYAIYMIVVVIVMLNALIAMMSSTYTRVAENSEVEWKVARTNLMAKYITTSATLPPPFNLVPTLRTVLNWLSSTFHKITARCNRDNQKSVREQREMAALHEENSYKILVDTLVSRFIRTHDGSDETGNIRPRSVDKLSDEIIETKTTLQQLENKMDILLQHFEKLQKQLDTFSEHMMHDFR